MSPKVVLVAGAGSLRATPITLAALASFPTDHILEIRLWDPDKERQDLFERFLAACLDVTDFGYEFRSYAEPVPAFDGVDAVLFTLSEHSARIFLAPPPSEEPHAEEEVEEPAQEHNLLEFGYGDRNRPTPRSRLSPAIKAMLHHPDLTLDRLQTLRLALERLELLVPEKAEVLSLVRGARMPSGRGVHYEWPKELTPEQRVSKPHEILRCVQGDIQLSEILDESKKSPVMRWLASL